MPVALALPVPVPLPVPAFLQQRLQRCCVEPQHCFVPAFASPIFLMGQKRSAGRDPQGHLVPLLGRSWRLIFLLLAEVWWWQK